MSATAEQLDVDGIPVRITNRDKVFFPKLGAAGTKGALIDYYRSVASGPMLTALRDRPTHLQRFPDGIDGEMIYQKRVPEKHPDYLKTCRITFPSGRTADALKVTHPSAIVWAAQMGSITLHPWQVRCPDTDHPDELRIDLDPQPGTGFAEARAVAVDILKPLLDELGLVGYPKTSGGRGVHVFVRIIADWDFVAVRRAGIALAREVERRAPELVTTAWWKEERGSKLICMRVVQISALKSCYATCGGVCHVSHKVRAPNGTLHREVCSRPQGGRGVGRSRRGPVAIRGCGEDKQRGLQLGVVITHMGAKPGE